MGSKRQKGRLANGRCRAAARPPARPIRLDRQRVAKAIHNSHCYSGWSWHSEILKLLLCCVWTQSSSDSMWWDMYADRTMRCATWIGNISLASGVMGDRAGRHLDAQKTDFPDKILATNADSPTSSCMHSYFRFLFVV